MNIQQAKDEIHRTLRAYHKKDAHGNYTYPVSRQRPLFLIGPPGIGKTAIMEQVAQEAGIGLVSYTMTHHTRQSAIGLPRIIEKEYEGKTVSLTSYTLSEIVASVYACIARTGRKEGILFVDEINCVSETLAPIMLQFLQNKQFGSHKVPEGFMIVAAGNPPQYNRSAKDFDIVTLDRVRRMDIEADLDCWMHYAAGNGVHPAVLSYLRLHPEQFYAARSNAAEKVFVTARGWEDLSTLLNAYEELGESVTEEIFRQFIGEEKTARAFGAYYRLYIKYGEDYGIDQILAGTMDENAYEQRVATAAQAPFDERMTLIGLMLGGIGRYLAVEDTAYTDWNLLVDRQDQINRVLREGGSLADMADEMEKALQVRIDQETISKAEEGKKRRQIGLIRSLGEKIQLAHVHDAGQREKIVEEAVDDAMWLVRGRAKETGAVLDRAFAFGEEAFGEEQEMLLLVTGLARDARAMQHITKHGCEAYTHWSSKLCMEEE